MFFFEYVAVAASMLASAAVAGTVPHIHRGAVAAPPPVAIPPRDVEVVRPRNLRGRSGSLMKRDANATFDLDFQVKNQILFDGASLDPLLNVSIPLTLECVDCRTFGSVEAVTYLPEDIGDFFEDLTDFELFNNANMSIIFHGVGAFVDLKLAAQLDQSFTLPLFATQTPVGVAGPMFQLGVVFFVDLVLGITGEVSAESGFEFRIPDGAAFTMTLASEVENTADFDGTTFELLPLNFEAPANVTVALRLRVQAGIEFVGSDLLSAQAIAGAFINIPQVTLGEVLTLGTNQTEDTCPLEVFAEININAGVFVDIGAEILDIELPRFNPTLSTTFFEAAFSTCLDLGLGGDASASPTPPPALPGNEEALPCPAGLVVETKTTVHPVALTVCAIPGAVNCPTEMAQVIMTERTETLTSSSCPGGFANATATHSVPVTYSAPITASRTVADTIATPTMTGTTSCESDDYAAAFTVAAVKPVGYGAVALSKLATPVTSELTVDPTIAPPDVMTINAIPGYPSIAAVGNNGKIPTPNVALRNGTIHTPSTARNGTYLSSL